MKDKNNITIRTTIDGEVACFQSTGYLTSSQDSYVITYLDYSGNTQTDNKLLIESNKMHLIRSGAMTSDMLFEENMVTQGLYSVLFYQAPIEVMTKSYELKDNETTLEVNIDYQLFESGSELANNQMTILIEK